MGELHFYEEKGGGIDGVRMEVRQRDWEKRREGGKTATGLEKK